MQFAGCHWGIPCDIQRGRLDGLDGLADGRRRVPRGGIAGDGGAVDPLHQKKSKKTEKSVSNLLTYGLKCGIIEA